MKRWPKHTEGGFTLLEVIVALGIFGVVSVAFIISLSTAFQTQAINEEQVQGENLARAQLEYIRNQVFVEAPAPYITPASGITVPPDYDITVQTTVYVDPAGTAYPPGDIQKNTVTVSRNGKTLVTVEDLKTRR